MPEVISNTSPLQYLHQLALLHLLPAFYGRVLIPQAIASELEIGRKEGVNLPVPAETPWLQIQSVAPPAWPLARDIHRGEAEALALAAQFQDPLLLLDDGTARQHARAMGLRITGTAGILLRAKRENKIPAVKPLIDQLEILGFHLDQTTRFNILKLHWNRKRGAYVADLCASRRTARRE